MKLPGYVTTKEFAEMCGVSASTVRYWVLRGIGPKPIHVGVSFLFPADEARQFAQNYVPHKTVAAVPPSWKQR
jgi:predicted DNA-binding transcriptional regulator AlpA